MGRDDVRRWLAREKSSRSKLITAVDLDALGYSLLSGIVLQDLGMVHELAAAGCALHRHPTVDGPQPAAHHEG